MKIFIIFVSLSLVLLSNGQQITKDQGHGPDHAHVHVDKQGVPVHVAGHKDTVVQNNAVVTEHIVVGQNVGHTVAPSVAAVQHQHVVSEHPKVSVQVPSHVQQVVTQVSQHVPVVVGQHVAKQRSLRSILEKALKCDFKCADTDLPICASNGRCHLQFQNQCELSAHNCLNAHKVFHQVDDFMCQDPDTIKCYPGDE